MSPPSPPPLPTGLVYTGSMPEAESSSSTHNMGSYQSFDMFSSSIDPADPFGGLLDEDAGYAGIDWPVHNSFPGSETTERPRDNWPQLDVLRKRRASSEEYQTPNLLAGGASAARGSELDLGHGDNEHIATEYEHGDPQRHTREAEPEISTFVIYTADDLPSSDEATTLRADDWQALANGGTLFSVHSPDAATAWVETHYEHPLLAAMRSHGLGGPIAAMVSPEVEALAVFGPISDTWILEAAQALSQLSRFTVMVRPLTDDPVLKWEKEASDSNTDSSNSDSKTRRGGIGRTFPPATEDDTQMDDGGGSSGGLKLLLPTSEDEDGKNPDFDMDTAADTGQIEMSGSQTDGSESDSEDDVDYVESSGGGMFRLRGGAGEDAVDYTPWLSPVHDADVILEIRPRTNITYQAAIRSKIQFKVQHKYEDKHRNGYRPQVISWTRFMVASNRFEVLPDRSYSSIGFLVRGQYISECKTIDCGFDQPNHITKVTETKTRGNTWTANIVGGASPTAGLSYARNNGSTREVENLNDRITPRCPVYYDDGGFWIKDGNHYASFNVSYEATADPIDVKKGIQHPLNVEFSMGINVVNRKNPNDPALPEIAFISRNQTMLWISDSNLKAKARGIVILTCSSIPDVETTDQLAIVEEQVVDLQRSAANMLDKIPAEYNASLSLLVGEIDATKNKPNLLKQILNKVTPKSTPEPQLVDLPLHEFKARGWNATLNRWRQPVYPALDINFRNATESSTAVWNLVAIGAEVDETAKLPDYKGKGREGVMTEVSNNTIASTEARSTSSSDISNSAKDRSILTPVGSMSSSGSTSFDSNTDIWKRTV
ncbi:hypothetical protein C8R44DRAFT_900749 [Mycena epipterygia]|nr:hypothetical protein C8R44DRAFT_900749 [Mycena epipterygia]